MDEGEKTAAREVTSQYVSEINSTPILTSLLYDADLMTNNAQAREQHFLNIAAQFRPQDQKGARVRNRMARHCVYKIFSECGDLLYVGMTANPDERLKQHARSSLFWRDGCHFKLEWADTRRGALNLEKATIKALKPKYNRIHND